MIIMAFLNVGPPIVARPFINGRPIMEDCLQKFVNYLKLRNCTPGTIYRYKRDVQFLLEHFGVEDPLQLHAGHVQDYLLFLLSDELLSPSTCRATLATLRTFFKVGVGRPEVTANIPWPKVSWCLPDIWTSEELVRLFAATKDLKFRTLLLTAYATGMRLSEVCHLQVTDIDRARGVIHVHLGKGKKDRFTILSPRLLKHLEDYWRMARPPRPYLFPGVRSGLAMPNKMVEAAMVEAVALSGVMKRATPHTLRHCFATHSLENGMDIHTLQVLLGHASIRTTQRYFHLSTRHISQAQSPFELLNLPTALEERR